MFSGTNLEFYLLGGSLLMLVSIFASAMSSTRLSVPTLAIFLGIGMLAGSEGIGGIYFDNVQLAQNLGVVALVYILFAGGLDTDTSDLRSVFFQGALLSTVGVFISAGIVGLFVYYFLKMPLLEALLLGSIISSTDAAAVFSILRSKNVRLQHRLKTLLEFESGSNDPMAIFLTVTFISLITSKDASVGGFFVTFMQQAIIGMLLGILAAYVIKALLHSLNLAYRGLYPALTFSMVMFTYSLTAALGGNGFLAVYVCGLFLAMQDFHFKKGLITFHDSIAWIMQILIFVTLGLLVFPSQIISVAWEGICISFVLFFIARPITVFTILPWFKTPMNEMLMTSWVGLRGAAPIVLATFPLMAELEAAKYIFNIVFFVVLLSVLIQGSTVAPVAKLLGVTLPDEEEAEPE